MCRQLGLPSECEYIPALYYLLSRCYIVYYAAPVATHRGFFGEGQDPIWLCHVDCDGTEDSILSCDYTTHFLYRDNHKDVGVICYSKSMNAYVDLFVIHVYIPDTKVLFL